MPRHTSPISFLNARKFNVSSKFHPLIFLLFLVLSASLHPVYAQDNQQECITNFDANKDYFPAKVSFGDNSDIKITYSNSYKVIEYDGKSLVLYQCGAPKPVDNVPADAKFFSVPVDKVAVMDTTSVTFLEVLNRRSSIAYAAFSELITSACIQKITSSENPSIQSINSLNETQSTEQLDGVDLVLSFMDPSLQPLDNQVEFAVTAKDVDDRINHLSLVSTFFNQESVSNIITTDIKDSYSCLSSASLKSTSSPVVAWTTFMAASDFNNNTASWSISFAAYKTELVKDAGGKNLDGEGTKMFSTIQEFKDAVKDVDIIIDETFASLTEADFRSNYQLNNGDGDYEFLKNKMVIHANKKSNSAGGSPWFESAILFDHVVLADLISFINPSLLKDYTTTYFRNIFSSDERVMILADECGNENEGLKVPVVDCPIADAAETSGVGRMVGGFVWIFVALIGLMC